MPGANYIAKSNTDWD